MEGSKRVKVLSYDEDGACVAKMVEYGEQDTVGDICERAFPGVGEHDKIYAPFEQTSDHVSLDVLAQAGGCLMMKQDDGKTYEFTIKVVHADNRVQLAIAPELLPLIAASASGTLTVNVGGVVIASYSVQ